jgi:hypothetical protein
MQRRPVKGGKEEGGGRHRGEDGKEMEKGLRKGRRGGGERIGGIAAILP